MFELLGAAVAVSVITIIEKGESIASLAKYINTGKAMMIIFGILLSVIIAFICGAIAQFFSRIIFTFDYLKRMKRYGAIWGGIALSFITYFILVKGAKGASFITPETAEAIKSNATIILLSIFAVSAVILQILLFAKINIFKPVVLIGTFALAMAFAANDLVNFIGVPMAGYHAYKAAASSGAPLEITMDALGKKVPTETHLLILAGIIMIITLWVSKKARSVAETEISLGQQEEGEERFESSFFSRMIVRNVILFFDTFKRITPPPLRLKIAKRLDATHYTANVDIENRPSFDLLRASVNLMVASAVISYATSQKLPLSTTYVTFMVAMGTSFADLAWGRESAVYRVTGVLTVIGGWFMTALLAFTISCLFAVGIYYLQGYGVLLIMALGALMIWKNHHRHMERAKTKEMDRVFNLKKVNNINETISTTFEHTSFIIQEMRVSFDAALEGLFTQNEYALLEEKKKTDKIQRWANIIIANVFKSMRLLQKENIDISNKYPQTIRRIQKLADGYRDIVIRSYMHVSNHHKGLHQTQVQELRRVKNLLHDILQEAESTFNKKQIANFDAVIKKQNELRELAENLNQIQAERIRNGESKTRLSILFYAIVGNALMLSKQNLKLMEIFNESFGKSRKTAEFDLD